MIITLQVLNLEGFLLLKRGMCIFFSHCDKMKLTRGFYNEKTTDNHVNDRYSFRVQWLQ